MKRMSVHRVLSGLSAMLLSTVVMVGVSGASATAASASPSTPYCVASVSGTSMRCFSTFGASITYATGGRVHLANATVARHVSSAELGQGGVHRRRPNQMATSFTPSTTQGLAGAAIL